MSRVCCYMETCYPNHHGEDSPTDSGSSSVSVNHESNSSTNGLSIATTILTLLSLVVVATAILTGHWLQTEEQIQRQVGRRHADSNNNASLEPEVKLTCSGLWKVCVALGFNTKYECLAIDYFPKEEYSPDPSDSTMAIPYAVTKSAGFFLTSVTLLVLAEVCYFAGLLIRPKPSLCVFIAGVMLIISGLLMFVGIVMYISIFKAEVGSKLRPRSSFQGPLFIYRYGYSFLLYVVGFIITEFAGTLAVFLHISWQQLEFVREKFKNKDFSHDSYHLESYYGTPQSNNIYRSYHLCERHQKKYLYEHDPTPECPHHHCFEYSNEYLPAVPTGCNHYHHGLTHDLTTETISTLADAVQDDYSVRTPREIATFDLGENLPPLPANVVNGWRSSSLKRTTHV